jgi:hypothetical protein
MGGWFFLGYIATLIAMVLIVLAALSLSEKLARADERVNGLVEQDAKREQSLKELDAKREAL